MFRNMPFGYYLFTRRIDMLRYTWNLATPQPQNDIPFKKIQEALMPRDVFIYTIENGTPTLTIFIPDEGGDVTDMDVTEKTAVSETATETENKQLPKRGRPASVPKNDLTLERILSMRRLGVSADDIAKELGVSKRTYYRGLEKLKSGGPHSYDTPFSKW